MYKLMAAFSAIIRNFYLPNPFVNLEYGLIVNIMIEPLLYKFTYAVVGLFYQRNSCPTLGSFLYLLFYMIHVSLLMIWGTFNFEKTAGIWIMIFYFSVITLIKILQRNVFKKIYF